MNTVMLITLQKACPSRKKEKQKTEEEKNTDELFFYDINKKYKGVKE